MTQNTRPTSRIQRLGKWLGYATSVVGAVTYVALAFLPRSSVSEPPHTAVSYLLGNSEAVHVYFQLNILILLFIAVGFAAYRRNLLFLWLLVVGSQASFFGVLPVFTQNLEVEPAVTVLTVLSLGTGVIPLSVLTGVTATLLTVDRYRNSDSLTTALTGRRTDETVRQPAEGEESLPWRLLSRAAGYVVSATAGGLAALWVVWKGPGEVFEPLTGQFVEFTGFLFLAVLVYEAVRTESMGLLTLLATMSTVAGVGGLRYGTNLPRVTLSAGVLLYVSTVALVYSRHGGPMGWFRRVSAAISSYVP